MVRPDLEFANLVWCTFKQSDITEIEKNQKRATKLVIKLKNKSYMDRLLHLNVSTLKYSIFPRGLFFIGAPCIYYAKCSLSICMYVMN